MQKVRQRIWAVSVLVIFSVFTRAQQTQFQSESAKKWDTKPENDATGNLIFQSVTSLLQHWQNTRYINGHTITPATISPGTLFYHSREDSKVPDTSEWLATDPEHSYVFCGTWPECHLLSFVTTRQLRVVYFDGTSAAKYYNSGVMDTQDLLFWGKFDWEKSPRERIEAACEWGKPFGIDGFVRMQMDFEVMLCDFSDGVKLVSNATIVNVYIPPPPPPPAIPYWNASVPPPGWKGSQRHINSVGFEVIQAGSWHNHAPGETRIRIDYSGMVSLFDPAIRSLVEARRNQSREEYRVANMSDADTSKIRARLWDIYSGGRKGSGIDWGSVAHVVTERYGDRLELLRHLLRNKGSRNSSEQAAQVRSQVLIMLTPYMLTEQIPLSTSGSRDWIAPIADLCSNSLTSWAPDDLNYQETVIRNAIGEVLHEICRVISDIWVDAFGIEDSSVYETEALLQKWETDVSRLMKWLDWSVWMKCNPACTFEEICYIPTWPWLPGVLAVPIEDDGLDPRCVRRLDPFPDFLQLPGTEKGFWRQRVP